MQSKENLNKQFVAKDWQKLINSERKSYMPVETFFKRVQPQAEEIWLDFGAGPGYFALPLAKLVKKVIATDLSPQMLQICKQRAAQQGLHNIDCIELNSHNLALKSNSIDKTLLSNVFHELDKPLPYLQEIHRVLKHLGKLFIIDWKVEQMEIGPPLEHRLHEDIIIEVCKQANFEFGWQWDDYPLHYVLEFRKVK